MPAPEPCAAPDPGSPSEPVVHEDLLDYTPTQRSVPLARRRVAQLVTEWGQPGLAGNVALVVSELMTNALLHGSVPGRLIRVRVTLGPHTLRVEVSDPRGERPPSPRPAKDATGQFGRGLLLVGALAARWGWEPRIVGKTVYAEWDVPEARRVLRTPTGTGESA